MFQLWKTATLFFFWTLDILVLSHMTLETSHYDCSFEELTCRIFKVSIAGQNDQLDTTVVGNRTADILAVQVTNATMLNFPSNFFIDFTNVRTVTVENCGLQDLQINHLISTLTVLKLPFNQLRQIRNGALKLAPNLKQLDLSDNKVSTIEEGALRDLKTLISVDLSDNLIETLPPSLFAGLKYLTTVLLSGNRLRTLDESQFNQTPDLFQLSLAFNALYSLPECLFHTTPMLYDLNLVGNRLTELPDNLFANLSNLCLLDLSNNSIKTVNIQQSLDLRYLGLEATHIQEFVSNSGMANLERLELSGNEFLKMSRVNLSELMRLKTLNLSSSRLFTNDLRPGLLKGLTNLETIDLSGNAFRTVDLKVFEGCEKLKSLFLNDTQLTNIGNLGLIRTKLKHLQYLDVSHSRLDSVGLAELKEVARHVSTVRTDGLNFTAPVGLESTTPSLLEVIAKFQAESQQFNSQTKKWLVVQSCLLALICFYALLKILMFIIRLFRGSLSESRHGQHYLLNDEIIL